MGVMKEALKYVSLLAMLIVSSRSDCILEKQLWVTENGTESREDQMARYRLPNNTVPRLYTIEIEPKMVHDDFTWTGVVRINVEVLSPTAILTLHAYENLVIDENFTSLVDKRGSHFKPAKQERDNDVELLKIKFDYQLPVSNYTLNIKFSGEQTRGLTGIFSYRLVDNSISVGTSFSPTSARRSFPCWDEPGFKAEFRVSIKHSPNYTAISNMPYIEKSPTPDGNIFTTFETTPLMSPHLLNFVVSQYHDHFNSHRNVSVHASFTTTDNINHVLDLTTKVVRVMSTYTGLPFGCPRIGSVLMPLYKTSGIEHWGLITYDQTLVNGHKSLVTSADKDNTDLLIAHELSHAWFGNRVTPSWWNDAWLSEAFAAYFEYYIIDQIDENWRGMELFVVRNNQEASFPNDNDNRIPVKWTPITNLEIQRMFESTTYKKGSAIVHMFRNVLGDDVFRAGIQTFLAKHSFKTAVTEDLTNEFQEAYNKGPRKDNPLNVSATLTSWLEQKGYPVVNITRNYVTGETVVSQKSSILEDTTGKWWIPLTYATKSNPNFTSTLPANWISDEEDLLRIVGFDKNDWIIVNVQASGYYRVNYDSKNWNRLARYLDTAHYQEIHVLNRAQLINDAFYLAQREPEQYYPNFYNLIKYLRREIEYLPWRAAHSAIIDIVDSLPGGSNEYKFFQSYILELMTAFIDSVGFEVRDTDDHFTKLSRTDVVHWACLAGHVGCANYAAQKIMEIAKNAVENPMHPDIRDWVFCAGLRGLNATAAKNFTIWAYENAKYLLLEQVGCTDNHEIHRNLLDKALTENNVGDPYGMSLVMYALLRSTEENFNYVVDYFMENHQAMNKSAVEDGWWYDMSSTLTTIINEVKTRDRLEKFEEIMQLDAIIADQQINREELVEMAHKNIYKSDISSNEFRKFWNKRLNNSTILIN